MTPLLSNSYFTNRTLILLTFDESETYSEPNRILSLLLGDAVPITLRGTNDTTFYTHYSILSTLESNFCLPNLGRYDVGANVFSVVANKTGYNNHASTINSSMIKLNKSYPGYLNSKKKLPIPNPNPFLEGAGRNGLLENLSRRSSSQVDTPYSGSGAAFDGESGNVPVYAVATRNDSTGTSPFNPQTTSATENSSRKTLPGILASVIAGIIAVAGSSL